MSGPPGIEGVVPADALLAALPEGARARWEADLALADAFISRFGWCAGISERHVGCEAGPVCVLLYRIVPQGDAAAWHWVVVGDAPPWVAEAGRAAAPGCAALAYCAEAERWVEAVRSGEPLDEVWPLLTADGRRLLEPTPEAADLVGQRVILVREAVMWQREDEIGAHCPDLAGT